MVVLFCSQNLAALYIRNWLHFKAGKIKVAFYHCWLSVLLALAFFAGLYPSGRFTTMDFD